jgi:hypothetical protein
MNLSSTQLRTLGSVLYFAAVTLIINFLAAFTIQIWPLKFSELNWRVGSVGLIFEVLLSTVVPLILVFLAAFMNDDRKILALLRWFVIALGIITLALLIFFALDSVQIRAALPQNVKSQFMKAALKAGLIGMILPMLFIWAGLSVGKVLKSQGATRAADNQDGMLMVGSREPSRPVLRAVDSADVKVDAKKGVSGGLSIDM